KDLSAIQLGEHAITAAITRAAIKPDDVDEVIMGNVLGAGLGQNVARQVAIAAGIPVEKSAFNVSKVCGSGLKATILGAQAIALGDAEIVVAGGTESMSNAMYLSAAARWGQRMGDSVLIDSLISDGLTDAFSGEQSIWGSPLKTWHKNTSSPGKSWTPMRRKASNALNGRRKTVVSTMKLCR
ncbi:TPA: beta-ketoacyl synthase N-terminal-like domain-containing protein, partial [Klebsiella oxytoca]